MTICKLNLRVTGKLLFSALLFTVTGCKAKVVSDQTLIDRFSANENSFDALSKSYEAGEVICPSEGDLDICKLATSAPLLPSLHGSDQLQVPYVKRNHGGDDGIWVPVQSYGAMSMSSSTRGYVYLKKAPSETIPDTLEESRSGTHYRQLTGNWFIFSVQ